MRGLHSLQASFCTAADEDCNVPYTLHSEPVIAVLSLRTLTALEHR